MSVLKGTSDNKHFDDTRFMTTTADILGRSRPPAITRRWSNHYNRLCAERDRLLARDCSTPQSSTTNPDDMADAGADQSLGDMSLVSAAVTKATLQEVLDAIHRIEQGTYGICEITGCPIEPERLKAIPWTRCSYAGQAELEQGGHRCRVRVPELGAVSQFESVEGDEEERAE
jgi:RNA polymerase-binding transcription factor DksA